MNLTDLLRNKIILDIILLFIGHYKRNNLRKISKLFKNIPYGLKFSKKEFSDLRPLSGYLNLEKLDCINTQVSDLSPLSGCINLKVLYLDHTKVSDLTPLSKCINLEVSVSYTHLTLPTTPYV